MRKAFSVSVIFTVLIALSGFAQIQKNDVFDANTFFAQSDSLEKCWTIGFQEIEKDVFVAFDRGGRISLLSDGSYSDEEMTRCFNYGRDVHDFVFYGQTVAPKQQTFPAYFLRAMNASSGVGIERNDRSFMFNSRGKLVGVVNSLNTVVNVNFSLQNFHFNIFNHEISHAKCCFITGPKQYDYFNEFGDGFGHWSHYLGRIPRGENSPNNCSAMLASPYVEISNGEAVTRNCHNAFPMFFSD